VDINRKYLAILAVLVAVNIVMAGLLYARLRERPVDPMAPVAGFTASQINVPGLPADDPNHWETKPASGYGRPPSAGYSLQSRFNMGTSYAVWGGELRCWVQNTGQKDMFVYGFSIEGDWVTPVCATVGITVQPGVERYLGILHFPGPALPGNYHFTVKTAIMVPTFVGGLLQSWYDFGHVGNAVKNIQILPVGEKPHYSEIKNPRYYFDKTNRIMAKDGSAKTKAAEIVANYSGGYSIYQAAAAFDFVFGNVVYVNDPAGRDYWATPDETLQKMTGDCEDHALLLSALITALGGNARFHVEKDHAFLSVFAGNDISAAQLALERYYNTGLQAAYFQDRFGYWLAADSTASMYLGGLPLGGEPLASGWGLTNTTFHYIVDMMPG
jgi:transglutaminase-like putative cysteine protease